ncbi:hypothetical protein SO802_004752 [Lithocarpus litseifolius]|uniref:DUF8040 domain-containing protein n=1 Tax=Lithocarpus litseifolius TaxID=425828 RepID=A0AAW2E7G7_9ROSI
MNVEPNYYSSSSFLNEEEDDDMFFLLMFVKNKNNYIPKEPRRISMLTSDAFIKEILNGNPRTCYELFRMDRPAFTSLCNYLRTHKFLTNSRWITVEEPVGMFQLIVGHNVRIRVIADRFQHSTETVDRQFKEIVRAICRLGKFIICPQSNEEHPRIANNTKFFPYFKFTFVDTGWEGTANDSQVFLDALQRPENNFPWPPSGGYYLVDSDYPCTLGFLPPYRTERYHLQDFRGGIVLKVLKSYSIIDIPLFVM